MDSSVGTCGSDSGAVFGDAAGIDSSAAGAASGVVAGAGLER